MGRVLSGVVSAVVLLFPLSAGAQGVVPAVICYEPPVAGRIIEPFRAPPCPYCAGQRGLEFAARAGEPVRAAAPGVVTFVGSVAGTSYLVVGHDDGRRATYGRPTRIRVVVGQRVRAGQVLAVTSEDGLYFGLRDGDRYVDPEPFLGRRRYPVRLVPVDGAARPRTVPGRLVCPMQGGSR